MVNKALQRLVSAVNRRRMKLLLGIALIAYVASVWGNFVNMRSIQENGELKIERKIEEIVEPLREKIRDLEKSFTQKYPPVKFLSEKDRKRILITGGAGFVGSHLTDKLMMDGHEVTVVDNFFTGRKRNVEHWIGHENFELINHDVVEPLYIEVDQIYHLASPASPPNYMYNPIKTLKTNTIGTLNMLGLAKRVGARLLLASTSEVYGDPEVHPQSEGYWGHVNPIGPRACYDEGKRVAETMCYAYMKQTVSRAQNHDWRHAVCAAAPFLSCCRSGSMAERKMQLRVQGHGPPTKHSHVMTPRTRNAGGIALELASLPRAVGFISKEPLCDIVSSQF
ncbi:UDP-glucuronic acid decarboxylase 1 isoform X2 [Pteropus vampyrus]|uniref:UDP-glucuronic acid decarboxylase 1 n=1 Tax=Pteropus vampyrus TaxID=132908 RepID=A0A6P3RFM1_PTEVA|nr:UDP-glucuronic acid decarboxylase 1 isoform X2 [Pteropus vampyrus]